MISGTDKGYFSKIKTISSNKMCHKKGTGRSRNTRWEKVVCNDENDPIMGAGKKRH
jgi:hypothetical protein